MELASMLAGERWSDHPAGVQPVLAAVARVVNDSVGEQDMARLEQLVPAMLGTATADTGSDARLVLVCATAALRAERVRSQPDLRAEVESARRMALRVLAATSRHAAAGEPAGGRLGRHSPTGGLVVGLVSSPLAQRWYRRTAVRQAALSAAAMAGAGPSDSAALCELLEACILALRRAPEAASN